MTEPDRALLGELTDEEGPDVPAFPEEEGQRLVPKMRPAPEKDQEVLNDPIYDPPWALLVLHEPRIGFPPVVSVILCDFLRGEDYDFQFVVIFKFW